MNARDKELAKQAWTESDWDGHVDIPKLIQLVRADEREACAQVCDVLAVHPEYISRVTLLAAEEIRARGNT